MFFFYFRATQNAYFALREWNHNVVGIERVVNAFQNLTIIVVLCENRYPDEDLKVDGTVVEALQYHVGRTFLVDTIQFGNGCLKKLLHLLYIRTISYANFENVQLIAVVLRHVLVVLGEQLRVLESYHRSVDCFDERRRVGDTGHATTDVVDDDIVANLYTAGHEGNTIIDVLQNILHSETDTSGQTTGNNYDPGVAHVEDIEHRDKPYAPDEHLDNILSHDVLRGGSGAVARGEVVLQQSQCCVVDILENEV